MWFKTTECKRSENEMKNLIELKKSYRCLCWCLFNRLIYSRYFL